MIINKEITTDKQKAKQKVKEIRKVNRKTYLTNWHPKFVIYKCIYDYDTNTKTHVFFQTIERKIRFKLRFKIRFVKGFDGYYEWKYKKYRVPFYIK